MGFREALDLNTYFYTEELFPGGNFWITKISGPKAFSVINEFVRVDFIESTKPLLYEFFNPETFTSLFKAKIVIFNSDESITGEKFVEIHFSCSEEIKNDFCNSLASFNGLKKGVILNFLEQRQKYDLQNSFQDKAVDVLSRSNDKKEKYEAVYFLNTNFEEIYSNWYKQLTDLYQMLETKSVKSTNEANLKKFIREVQANIQKINDEIIEHMARVVRFNAISMKSDKKNLPDGDVYKSLCSIIEEVGEKNYQSSASEVALSIGKLKRSLD